MARKIPVLTRDGNENALNTEMSSEVLYVRDGANMGDAPFLMDVSERGHAEILDELTDLSANKGAYALREVYSNAHDATVRAGDMTRPIEITIPLISASEGSLAEKLAMANGVSEEAIDYATVTDHGIGMTEYDLRTYFTQYGGSNKRGEVASIGSKGLGSKAPLAVADYFDVTTSKDGVRTSMHLWRAEDGNYAEVTGSDPCPADETGTTVRIPVMNHTIGHQMLECAKEIARYNSDAVVIVNGQETAGTLNREVGSVSRIDDQDYVCLGSVRIGTDGQGNPVSVPTWLSTEVFRLRLMPWAGDDVPVAVRKSDSRLEVADGGIRAVLCGIGYQLVTGSSKSRSYHYYSGWHEPVPTCIVEVEPGYLNFTVSRDEVKDDQRKAALVDALRQAIDSLDLWGAEILRRAHDFKALLELLAGRSLRRLRNGRWAITESYADSVAGNRHILSRVEEQAMTDEDGRSWLPLLATFDGSDRHGHDARILGWFSSAYNGKSARFHCAYTDTERVDGDETTDNWTGDLRSWKFGTSSVRGSEGQNSFSPKVETICTLVADKLPYAQISSAVRNGFRDDWSLMVIGGVTPEAFAKAEHSIRRHVAAAMGRTVLQTPIVYVLCDGPVSDRLGEAGCLSESELALLSVMGGHAEVAMLDELARRCSKEDRARSKSGGTKTRAKGPKPLGLFACMRATLSPDSFATVGDAVAAAANTTGVPSTAEGTLKREVVDLDTLTDGDLVVIGKPADEKCVAVAMQATILQKMGLLDGSFGSVLFVPASHDGRERGKGGSLYAPQVKRLAKSVAVLCDLREKWAVESVESIMDGIDFMEQGTGIDIDRAGIEADDAIRTAVAPGRRYVSAGDRWLIDNIKTGVELADRAFATIGDNGMFAVPVLEISTEDASVKALSKWMSSVRSVVSSYRVMGVLENADDPEIRPFAQTMVEGVVRAATRAYEKDIAAIA